MKTTDLLKFYDKNGNEVVINEKPYSESHRPPLSVSNSGSGNAVTGVSVNQNTGVITVTKGSTFSLSSHNHDDNYAAKSHSHSWDEVTGKPSSFTPASHSHSYNDLTNKPSLFDGTWASLSGKPSSFTPSSHSHSWSSITGKPISDYEQIAIVNTSNATIKLLDGYKYIIMAPYNNLSITSLNLSGCKYAEFVCFGGPGGVLNLRGYAIDVGITPIMGGAGLISTASIRLDLPSGIVSIFRKRVY